MFPIVFLFFYREKIEPVEKYDLYFSVFLSLIVREKNTLAINSTLKPRERHLRNSLSSYFHEGV